MSTKNSVGRPGPADEGRWTILEAAAEAFMVSGYNGTSIDDIADLLGATKGRIYHYFRSKADIYIEIHATFVSMMLDEVSAIAADTWPPTEKLQRMSKTHALMVMEKPAFARVAMVHTEGYEASGRRRQDAQREILEIRSRYEQRFRDVIAAGVESEAFRPVNARVSAKLLLGALNWLAVWYRPDVLDTSPTELATELSTFVVNGLRREFL